MQIFRRISPLKFRCKKHVFKGTRSRRGIAKQSINFSCFISIQGIRCDCCGVDPIEGPRFSCANVPDVDICQACATLEDQSFMPGGIEFSELAWKVLVTPESFDDAVPFQSLQATYANEEAADATPAAFATDISGNAAAPQSSAAVLGSVADLPRVAEEMQVKI